MAEHEVRVSCAPDTPLLCEHIVTISRGPDVESAGHDRPEATEIEVTPEMVEAGFNAALENYAFWQDGLDEEELKEALIPIFRAMVMSQSGRVSMAESDPIQPPVIWLSPWCEGCNAHIRVSDPSEGQLWCAEPQDECSECGLGWTRYVLDEQQAKTVKPRQTTDD